ncbi:MAG: FAD-dependent oxidoreductase [Bryobacterales bacterium]|nr:FAD-dependent oxidoreductase [Bryobacterales bacterium]
MPSVCVVGGGLAGLAAAAALGEAGLDVDVYETRPFLGGRATSYPAPGVAEHEETIDNCQHILLGCCVNLIDFYRRLGVEGKVRFWREFTFLEPGGRASKMRATSLPAPLHFSGSFLTMPCFDWSDRLAIGRAMLNLMREAGRRDLDSITMADWLAGQRQTPRAMERFWRQVLVSAINEELDRMAASHAFQVFRLGFLAGGKWSAMGVPAVPLAELYGEAAWSRLPTVRIHTRAQVESVQGGVTLAGGERREADAVVLAVPWERAAGLAPHLGLDFTGWEHSPITGIHLWFDRAVTELPHATLLDRTMQWMFNKRDGRHIQLVVSASRGLTGMGKNEVVELAMRELTEFLPEVARARLERSHVVKEMRATFSAKPGLEARRPAAETSDGRLFLAGDWTRSGWPATMEGAVRSGYLAAEAVCRKLGRAGRFLKPDVG